MKVYGEMRQEKTKIDDKINKLFTHPKEQGGWNFCRKRETLSALSMQCDLSLAYRGILSGKAGGDHIYMVKHLSVQFSSSVVSDSLRLHEPRHFISVL